MESDSREERKWKINYFASESQCEEAIRGCS